MDRWLLDVIGLRRRCVCHHGWTRRLWFGNARAGAGSAPLSAGKGRAARRLAVADLALDHDVGRSADEDQMLDIVAAYQHEAAMAVDGGGVHDRQPRLAVAPARHKRAERHAADQLDDDENDDEQDKGSECPKDCAGKCWTRQTFDPLKH